VQPYISAGEVESIRLSTRPDCLSEELCSFLSSYGVKTIELGVQSMSESVLEQVHRGHGVEAVRKSLVMLQDHGFETGVQLMVGLPGETTKSFLQGVAELAGYRPRFARLYPALVIDNTALAELYFSGSYSPLSLHRAVTLCGRAWDLLRAAGTQVIRVGLQPSADLEQDVLAGPYHPAFGELVRGRHWYLISRDLVTRAGSGKTVTITVAQQEYSSFVGQKRMNIDRLNRRPGGASLVVKADKSLDREQYSYVVS
jgi:histone acetyltransferase (RNA polymerase elongator complex component)